MTEQSAYLLMAFIFGFLANHIFTFFVVKTLNKKSEPKSKQVDQTG